MPESVSRAVKEWLAPALLAALLAICGYLWMDMREQVGRLNDAVVRLTALQERA
jgi:hypothetical protein